MAQERSITLADQELADFEKQLIAQRRRELDEAKQASDHSAWVRFYHQTEELNMEELLIELEGKGTPQPIQWQWGRKGWSRYISQDPRNINLTFITPKWAIEALRGRYVTSFRNPNSLADLKKSEGLMELLDQPWYLEKPNSFPAIKQLLDFRHYPVTETSAVALVRAEFWHRMGWKIIGAPQEPTSKRSSTKTQVAS